MDKCPKFELYGSCPSGGTHHIVPKDSQAKPCAGVAWRICWKCKSIFCWVVGPPTETEVEPEQADKL